MLDLTGIMVSSIMMLIVIIRAVQLDSRAPWFETPPKPDGPKSGLEKARANAARQNPRHGCAPDRWDRRLGHGASGLYSTALAPRAGS